MPRISFGAPLLLPLIAVALLLAAFYWWMFRRRREAEQRYRGTGTGLRSASFSPSRQVLKAALVVVAVALLGLAAALPRAGTKRQVLQKEGTDVVVALDVSLSMSARDASPTRLDRAKAAIGALIDHLQGDRLGLVTFAGSANLRFPLTTDAEAARAVLDSVTYKDGGLQAGTSISSALRQATQGFANDQTRSKVLVLVSDGEDLGDDAAGAAQFVQSEGISLDTIGVGGTDPVQILVNNPRTQRYDPVLDPNTRQPVTTTADPKALQQLAASNQGQFYNGNTDDFAVQLADEIGRLPEDTLRER